MAQTVKRLPTMRESWVQSLGWEDLLEKEMATHSSILAWKIPWMEEPGGLHSSWGRKESDTTERHSLTRARIKKNTTHVGFGIICGFRYTVGVLGGIFCG